MIIKKYILLIVFTLPIDWFSPSGTVFREAGSKPVNLIILMLGFFLPSTKIFTYQRSNLKLRNI